MSTISREVEQRPWRIELLGSLRVRHVETPVHLRRRVASQLLAYLAMSPDQTFTRDALMERLWPDLPEADAANYLRVSLSCLRTTLASVSDTPLLEIERHQVRLFSARMACDVLEFDRARTSGLAQREGEGTDLLRTAAHYYQGSLLPEFDASWLIPVRRRLEDDYLHVLRRLIRQLSRHGRPEESIEFARRLLEIDPLQESSHRELMRLYMQLDRPAAARRQYHELVALLERELGVEPEEETQRLATLLLGDPDAPQPAPVEIPAPIFDRPDPLPTTPTQFIGREDEADNLAELLLGHASHLVTVTGLPGVGKTRLAIEVGRRIRDAYSGGVRFVALAEQRDAEALPEVLAGAVNAPPASAGGTTLERVAAHLRFGKQLLILDNLEQLLPGAAPILAQLSDAAPELTILVTSRQRLGVVGEQIYPLLPLSAPADSDEPMEVQRAASVRLFLNRARLVRPDLRIEPRNARIISQICQQLDGLPLAIELAASWSHTFTPSQMLKRLKSRRFDLLSDPDVGAIPGVAPRALWDAIDGSYKLLDSYDVVVFEIIGLMVSGISTIILEEIVGSEYRNSIRSLIDSSLVYVQEFENVMIIDMKESIREFSRIRATIDREITECRIVWHIILALVSNRGNGMEDFDASCSNLSLIKDDSACICEDWSSVSFEAFTSLEEYFVRTGNLRSANLVARVLNRLMINVETDSKSLLRAYKVFLLLNEFSIVENVLLYIDLKELSDDEKNLKRALDFMRDIVLLKVNSSDIVIDNVIDLVNSVVDDNNRQFMIVNISSILTFTYKMYEGSDILLDEFGRCGESTLDIGVKFLRSRNVESRDPLLSLQLLNECLDLAVKLRAGRYIGHLNIHIARILILKDAEMAMKLSVKNLKDAINKMDNAPLIQAVLNIVEIMYIYNENRKANELLYIAKSKISTMPPYIERDFAIYVSNLIEKYQDRYYDIFVPDIDDYLVKYTDSLQL